MRDSAGYETIVFERRRPVGLLRRDRPERLDAINRQMIDELNRCPDAAERDVDMRVLVLAGAALASRDSRFGSWRVGLDLWGWEALRRISESEKAMAARRREPRP